MHTPGPWYLSRHGRYVRYEGVHGPNICDLDVFGGPPAEGAANAQLIAKAPALLESLKELSEWMRSHLGPSDGIHDMLCRAVENIQEADALYGVGAKPV